MNDQNITKHAALYLSVSYYWSLSEC